MQRLICYTLIVFFFFFNDALSEECQLFEMQCDIFFATAQETLFYDQFSLIIFTKHNKSIFYLLWR